MLTSIGSGPMGELIGIDYFHLVAGFFNVVGMFGFLGTAIFCAPLLVDSLKGSSGFIRGLSLFVIACGCIALSVFLLGGAAANMGLVQTAYDPALPVDEIGGSLLLIVLGAMVASLPAASRRYESWLDRRYPKA